MTEQEEQEPRPKQLKVLPLTLHSNVLMLLQVYEYKGKSDIDEYFRNMWLTEGYDFHDNIKNSARHMVSQLSDNACALFWMELVKAILEQLKDHDTAYGSDHHEKLLREILGWKEGKAE